MQFGVLRVAAIAEESWIAVSHDGVDDAVGGDLADAVVAGVGDVDVPVGIDCDALGNAQQPIDGGASVVILAGSAAQAGLAGAGKGGDDAVRSDHADAVIGGVGDVQIAGGVDGQALRGVQLGVHGGAVVAREASARVSGYQCQNTGGSHLENGVRTTEVDIAALVEGHAVRLADGDLGGGHGRGRGRTAGHSRNSVLLRYSNGCACKQQKKSQHGNIPS